MIYLGAVSSFNTTPPYRQMYRVILVEELNLRSDGNLDVVAILEDESRQRKASFLSAGVTVQKGWNHLEETGTKRRRTHQTVPGRFANEASPWSFCCCLLHGRRSHLGHTSCSAVQQHLWRPSQLLFHANPVKFRLHLPPPPVPLFWPRVWKLFRSAAPFQQGLWPQKPLQIWMVKVQALIPTQRKTIFHQGSMICCL